MNPRYPAPEAEEIWSKQARAKRMRNISIRYARDAVKVRPEIVRPEGWDEPRILTALAKPLKVDTDVSLWETYEESYGHEIVGFLQALMADLEPDVCRYLHYGLTSSDLTEFDLHQACAQHALGMSDTLHAFWFSLVNLATEYSDVPRAGRTHGRIAEQTLLGNQFEVHAYQVGRVVSEMDGYSGRVPFKSPGPTGVSGRKPTYPYATPSTQIIGRDWLLGWACAYLRTANVLDQIATWVRLGCRADVDEFREGKADTRQGSSAMPGKANPIDSEKVCGLARVARGHFTAISQVSGLWEDRDLTNSSTERIAVPDLAATVEHMVITMRQVIGNLQIDLDKMERNSQLPGTSANAMQTLVQAQLGLDPILASEYVKRNHKETNK